LGFGISLQDRGQPASQLAIGCFTLVDIDG